MQTRGGCEVLGALVGPGCSQDVTWMRPGQTQAPASTCHSLGQSTLPHAERVRSKDPASGQKDCFSGFPAPDLLPTRGP